MDGVREWEEVSKERESEDTMSCPVQLLQIQLHPRIVWRRKQRVKKHQDRRLSSSLFYDLHLSVIKVVKKVYFIEVFSLLCTLFYFEQKTEQILNPLKNLWNLPPSILWKILPSDVSVCLSFFSLKDNQEIQQNEMKMDLSVSALFSSWLKSLAVHLEFTTECLPGFQTRKNKNVMRGKQ